MALTYRGFSLPALLLQAGVGLALLCAALAPRAWDADRMAAAAQRLGPRAVEAAHALRPLIAQASTLEEGARLPLVNEFFNRRVLLRDDSAVWGQLDYWASPLETLNQGAGDCEDHAIAKYLTLLSSGMPASRLRLVYVRAQVGGGVQAHMVLAYYAQPDAEPLILDSLVAPVRPASRRPDLVPVFSFNSEGLWQEGGGAAADDPVARLSRWRGVLEKAKAEGFLN